MVQSPDLKVEQPWTRSREETLEALDVSRERGLDEATAKKRRQVAGVNRLRSIERKSAWQILVEQFKSLIVLLLAVATILSFTFGELVEGAAVAVVILINAAIGFVTELRAVRSMEALQKLSRVDAKVRRDGAVHEIPAERLSPGDIVILDGGDVVTADLRLLEASKLQANESALTGESVPVSKQVEPLSEDAPLAERANMVFKGTAITRGTGEGVVVATGMDTELGRISTLVEEAEEEATPLERRLQQLGHRLIWVTLGIGAAVVVAGVVGGKDVLLMIETAIALAVASIPEGLPIVATVALARGMWRMAQRNALINNLSSVETLGATNVILTDKTGTLTENQMTATRFVLASGEAVQVTGEGLDTEGEFQRDGETLNPAEEELLRQALEVGVLCNNAALQADEDGSQDTDVEAIGDPVEAALLVAGAKAGIRRARLLDEQPEAREDAFDPDVKMMATFNEENGQYRVAVKGALEAALAASSQIMTPEGEGRAIDDAERERWRERNIRMAEEGLRVLALATKTVASTDVEPYEDLIFIGLVGLLDPPREDVQPAIEAAQSAGVRVVMATGDQAATAKNVARAVGLASADADVRAVHGSELGGRSDWSADERQKILEAPIFARVTPEQKLDLIALHQENGAIVAMTGDGVNDAPALKKADIGVAMGQRGAQVAQEASDMVLQDDAFSSIVVAIEQGRVIFNNIRRFVLYLLSCNMAEIMVIGLASVVNAPLPIRPLQILFLNLVTDVFPALALGVGEGDPAIMEQPPRDPDESIMTKRNWTAVFGYGALITASVLGAFAIAFTWLGTGTDRAVTISFLTLACAQLWHVFDMRDPGSHFLRNDVTRNTYVWGAVGLCVGLLLLAVYVPLLADLLSVVDPGVKGWGVIVGMSLIPWAVGQTLAQFELNL
jgi:P-type Ca2+ transporter type 2C